MLLHHREVPGKVGTCLGCPNKGFPPSPAKLCPPQPWAELCGGERLELQHLNSIPILPPWSRKIARDRAPFAVK